MDSKITLSFDSEVIRDAKEYADNNDISLSRLVEFLLRRTILEQYGSLEEYPISEWVKQIADGRVEYYTPKRGRKDLKDEFFSSKK